jgi:glycosyltransferase involved in cell wall biosynthesis
MAVYVANGLVQNGFDVEMVLFAVEGRNCSLLLPEVRVVDLHSGGSMQSIIPLAGYLRRTRPDVLMSHLDHVNVAALLARRLSRVDTRVLPVVHTTHSMAHARGRGLKLRALHIAIQRCYPWADAVVVVSHDAAQDLIHTIGLSPRKVRVIFPILTPRIAELAKETADHPWLASGQPDVILSVGRLTVQKDLPTLIHAYANVRQRRKCRLLIVGEGEERGNLEQLVADLGLNDDVSMPGYVANAFAYMSRCSLYVSSSRWEAMPMALVEALAAGATVVATDCKSGPNEILSGGRFGSLVPVGDVEALANAIYNTMAKPRSQVSTEALEPFDANRVIQQYVTLIQEVTTEGW